MRKNDRRNINQGVTEGLCGKRTLRLKFDRRSGRGCKACTRSTRQQSARPCGPREVSEGERGVRAETHRASKGTLGTCDSGFAGIMVAMERGRRVKAHTGGAVTDWNKSKLWSQQNEGQTPAV